MKKSLKWSKLLPTDLEQRIQNAEIEAKLEAMRERMKVIHEDVSLMNPADVAIMVSASLGASWLKDAAAVLAWARAFLYFPYHTDNENSARTGASPYTTAAMPRKGAKLTAYTSYYDSGCHIIEQGAQPTGIVADSDIDMDACKNGGLCGATVTFGDGSSAWYALVPQYTELPPGVGYDARSDNTFQTPRSMSREFGLTYPFSLTILRQSGVLYGTQKRIETNFPDAARWSQRAADPRCAALRADLAVGAAAEDAQALRDCRFAEPHDVHLYSQAQLVARGAHAALLPIAHTGFAVACAWTLHNRVQALLRPTAPSPPPTVAALARAAAAGVGVAAVLFAFGSGDCTSTWWERNEPALTGVGVAAVLAARGQRPALVDAVVLAGALLQMAAAVAGIYATAAAVVAAALAATLYLFAGSLRGGEAEGTSEEVEDTSEAVEEEEEGAGSHVPPSRRG